MMAKVAGYPFEERSRQLGEMASDSPIDGHFATSNTYEGFTALLGRLYGRADADSKRNIAKIVGGGHLHPTARPAEQTPTFNTTASPDSHTEAHGPRVTDDGLNLHTAALDRYCDREGLAVEWPTTEVPASRTQFRCIARVAGREFVGEGKNMRVAKHRASREACIAFHIEI